MASMRSHNKFLKNILSTTCSLTIALCVANEAAEAVTHTVTTGNVYLQGTGQTSNGGGLGGAVINSGDTFGFTSAANIRFTLGTIAGGFNLGGLNLSSKVIQIESGASTMGSIGNAAASTYMPLSVQDGASLTLNGAAADGTVGANNYSALGGVTLGSTTGGSAGTALSITATGPVTFTNTFDSYAGTTGNFPALNISGAAHIFNGVIGGNSPLGIVSITGVTPTFSNNVTANTITLTNNSSQALFTGGTTTANITNSSGTNGTSTNLQIGGSDVVITGNIGASGAALFSIAFQNNNNNLTVNGNIYATHISTPNALPSTNTLTMIGGTTGSPNILSVSNLNFNSMNFGNSADFKINVGNSSTSGNVNFPNSLASSSSPMQQLNIAANSSATLYNNAYFGVRSGNTYSGPLGVSIGENATLTIDSGLRAITLNGPIDGVSNGYGALVLKATGGPIISRSEVLLVLLAHLAILQLVSLLETR